MDKTELIITEKDPKFGWCLFRVLGERDRQEAEKVLAELQTTYETKALRIEEVAKEDCWWNGKLD